MSAGAIASASSGADHPPVVAPAKNQAEANAGSSDSNSDGQGSLILRIKRKRGTDPITALRIETLLSEGVDPSEAEERATRLDTERLEDRMDGSTRAKRRLTERGVFRLAETVSISSFADARATQQLEQRISQLKKVSASVSASSTVPQQPIVAGKEQDGTSKAPTGADGPSRSSALRFKVIKPASKDRNRLGLIGGLKSKSSLGSLRAKIRSGNHGRAVNKSSVSSLRKQSDGPGTPRKSPYPSKLRFIDAVMERTGRAMHGGSDGRKEKKGSLGDTEMESLDRRFADLLGNYLKENDLEAPSDLYESSKRSSRQPESTTLSSSSSDDSEGEYVYDIYFREKETKWGSGPAGASDAGLRPAEVAGRDVAPVYEAGQAVAAEPQYTVEPMATLVGLGDEDDLIAEMENASKLMAQEVPGDSDDDFDEGEDEDSNDEGFYRNDYPEDEGEEEDEMVQAGWGWSGPRRRGQRPSSSDEEGDEEDDEDGGEGGYESDDIHD